MQWSKTMAQSAAMATCDRDAVLENLYNEMEQEMQVGRSSVWFYVFIVNPLCSVVELIIDTARPVQITFLNQACL